MPIDVRNARVALAIWPHDWAWPRITAGRILAAGLRSTSSVNHCRSSWPEKAQDGAAVDLLERAVAGDLAGEDGPAAEAQEGDGGAGGDEDPGALGSWCVRHAICSLRSVCLDGGSG